MRKIPILDLGLITQLTHGPHICFSWTMFFLQGWQTTGHFLADTNNHSFCLYILTSAADSRVQLHDMSFFEGGRGVRGEIKFCCYFILNLIQELYPQEHSYMKTKHCVPYWYMWPAQNQIWKVSRTKCVPTVSLRTYTVYRSQEQQNQQTCNSKYLKFH